MSFVVDSAGSEPRALQMLDKHSTTESQFPDYIFKQGLFTLKVKNFFDSTFFLGDTSSI